MKALSIKQPWASLIAHGIKDIENRTWRTHFRGKIFIHSSAKNVPSFTFTKEQSDAIDHIPEHQKFTTSAIVGEVEIIDCVINHSSIWAEQTAIISKDKEFGYPNYDNPVWNWVLANAILYKKPILNVKGKLSFWEPDIDIVECIGCADKFNFEELEQDDASENYCQECWEVLSPIMAQEAKENMEK